MSETDPPVNYDTVKRGSSGNGPASPPKRQATLRSLCGFKDSEFIPDEFDDHERNNEDVERLIQAMTILPTTMEDHLVTSILVSVAVYCSNLDRKYSGYDDALGFISAQGERFKELLRKCWEVKDFSVIRFYIPLQAPGTGHIEPRKKTSPNVHREAEFRERFYQAVTRAWKDEYSGKTQILFRDTLNQMNREREDVPYANYLPIVQSSGTGKSRLVDEYAKLVFTIPFNVREKGFNPDQGFPPADEFIRSYFLRACSFELSRRRFLLFFTNLFNAVKDCIVKIAPNAGGGGGVAGMARAWKDYLETDREALYDRVAKESGIILSKLELLESFEVSKYEEQAKCALQGLLDLWREKTGVPNGNKDVCIAICFDEAHTLINEAVLSKGRERDGRTIFDALCSTMNTFAEFEVFFIVVSTNFTVSRFSPAKYMHPSARVLSSVDTRQIPFTELPFDVLQNGQPFITSGEMTLDEVSTVRFMCQFGRPLFRGLLDHGMGEEEIIAFARSKLIARQPGSDSSWKGYNLSLNAQLAVLGSRLLLEFNQALGSARFKEVQLVESHMRIVYSIPQHREYLASGYPSEPILAEAAAQEMRQWSARKAIIALSEHAESGLISKGERGELVARLILILAYDKAATKYYNSKGKYKNGPLHFSDAVPLVYFLAELFSGKNVEKVLISKPDNDPSSVPLRDAFKDAYVRFTHFVRAGDKFSSSTTEFAWIAIVRGMAIQCVPGHKTFDLFIPIAYRNGPLCEERVSFLAVSINDRAKEQTVASVAIDEAKLNIFPKDRKDGRPYIALVMELGVQPKERTARKGDVVRGTPRNNVGVVGDPLHPKHTHPRYSIYAYGCSGAVYGVIEDRDDFAGLLASRDVLSDHTRKTHEALSAIAKLKPSWKDTADCCDWVGFSKTDSGYISGAEEVLTGDNLEQDEDD